MTATDVSVVGYDDITPAGHPLISLTTIDQSGVATSQIATDLLMERIRDGRTSTKHDRIKPQLRIRNSTKRAKSFAR